MRDARPFYLFLQAPTTQATVVASGVISGTVECMIVGVNVVLNRTVVDSDRRSTTCAVRQLIVFFSLVDYKLVQIKENPYQYLDPIQKSQLLWTKTNAVKDNKNAKKNEANILASRPKKLGQKRSCKQSGEPKFPFPSFSNACQAG